MIAIDEELIIAPGTDDTPSLVEQAKAQGWEAGEFSFGKAESASVHYFNPSLVERPDGLWLIVRRAEFQSPRDTFGMNACYAFKLDKDLKPEFGDPLKFESQNSQEQFEDPRAIFFKDHVWIGVCSFIWYGDGNWTGAHQTLGVFKSNPGGSDDWAEIKTFRPEIGGNSAQVDQQGMRHEKNWLWFMVNGKLHVLYHSNPWRVAAFGQNFQDAIPYESEGVSCTYGEIRGGTPPVLHDGLYWTFFHSSVPWIDRFRRYHMGAIGFEPNPPFKPVKITPQPLLTGSQNDYWLPKKPLVVFPGGARIKDGKWLIVYGVNDLKCGFCQIPHKDILRLSKPIDQLDPKELACEELLSGGVERRHAASESKTARTEQDSAQTNADELALVNSVVSQQSGSSAPPAQKSDRRVDKWSSRQPHKLEIVGSNPTPATQSGIVAAAPAITSNGDGFKIIHSTMDHQETLGDRIRFHVEALITIEDGNPNRKARILAYMRKRRLIPQARRR